MSAGARRGRRPRGMRSGDLGGCVPAPWDERVWREPRPFILVGRGTRAFIEVRLSTKERFAMLSDTGLPRSIGTTSSQSPSGHRVIRTMPFRPYVSAGRSSEGIVLVDSSSGRSYTLTELCMCTGSFRPLDGQMSFSNMLSGDHYSTPSEERRCVECNLVRPYRITSASM